MGKMINFAHLNAQANFTAILNHYNLEYTRTGSQIRLLCPFHEDRKPSLSITLADTDRARANTFHCFGCGEKGSVIDFVSMLVRDDDLRGVAEEIASITGCSLAPAQKSKRRKRRSSKGQERPSDSRKAAKGRSAGKDAQKPPNGDPRLPNGRPYHRRSLWVRADRNRHHRLAFGLHPRTQLRGKETPYVVLFAEAITALLIPTFCLLLASDGLRGSVFDIATKDPVGRILIRNVRIALVLGYGTFFASTIAITFGFI